MLGADKWDSGPALSLDEHRLYFATERPGGCGGEDIWVSYRRDRRDDLGWEPPVHLACEADGGPNSASRDLTPALFEDEAGQVLMYFSSNRTGSTSTPTFVPSLGNWDLWVARRDKVRCYTLCLQGR